MTTFSERLAAAQLRLKELPAEVSVVQASRMLTGAGGALQIQWMKLLNDAIAAGELASQQVTLPRRRYDRLDNMKEIEQQKPRTEQRIKLVDLEAWLERIGGPTPPWRARAEVDAPDRTRRAIARELERRHVRG